MLRKVGWGNDELEAISFTENMPDSYFERAFGDKDFGSQVTSKIENLYFQFYDESDELYNNNELVVLFKKYCEKTKKKFDKELCKLNDVNAWEQKKEEVIEWEEKIKDEGIEYGGFYDYLVEHFTKECKSHSEEKPYVKIAGLTKNDSLSEGNYICKKIESMADYLLHAKEETKIKENKDSVYPILKAKGNNSLNITRIKKFETLERFDNFNDDEQGIFQKEYTDKDSIDTRMHDTRYPSEGESVTANLKSPEIDVVKCPKAAGIFVNTGID